MTARIKMRTGGATRPLSYETDACTLLQASAVTPWAGVPFELHRMVSFEAPESGPVDGEYALLVLLDGCVEMAAHLGGRDRTYRAVPGSTFFLSWDERSASRATGSGEVAVLQLQPEWFQRVDQEQAPAGFGRTPPLTADATARELANAMRREVLSGTRKGRLYAESLSLAFLSYVLDHVPLSSLRVRGALSEQQRRLLARHIRERLGDDLSVDDLASLVGLGTHRFSRLFRESFGMPPYGYVLGQRLEEGARRLAEGPHDIAEIAHALGFSSQSHFAAAFRKRYRQTPRQYMLEHRCVRPFGR